MKEGIKQKQNLKCNFLLAESENQINSIRIQQQFQFVKSAKIKIQYCISTIMYNFFKKKAPTQDNTKTQLQDYHNVKNKLQIPLKIKLFLEILQNSIDEKTEKKKIPKEITDIYKQFTKCFTKLPLEEKLHFLLGMIKIVESILKEKNYNHAKTNIQYEGKIDNIETSCLVRQFFVGVSIWEERIFKFFNVEKIVKICSHNNLKKQIVFQLNQYHLRSSAKQKNTLVFESIFDSWKINEKYQTYYIHFKNQTVFNQVYNILRNAIIMSWKARLVGMLNETSKGKIQNMATSENIVSVGVRILTSKTISDYFKTRQVVNKLMNKNIKWKQFSEIRRVKIYRSTKYENLYKTQNVIEHSYDDVLQNIELVNRVPSKKLLHYEKMESFSSTISAVYYKYMVKGCTHEMLCMVEEIKKENECRVTYKAIDNFVMDKNVDFVEIKVQRIGAGKTKVSALGFINFDENKKLNPVSVVDFFLSIVEYQQEDQSTVLRSTVKYEASYQVESTKIHQEPHDQQVNGDSDDDEFHTVAGDNFDSDEERELECCNTFESPKKGGLDVDDDSSDHETIHERNVINEFRCENNSEETHIRKETSRYEIDASLINEIDYLKKRQPRDPHAAKDKKQLILEHYFVGEWANYEKGGLYSLNKKMVDKQKQIYQSFLTRVGKALMTKKLSNISIPVIALRDESFLQSIARNMSYGPLLLEKQQLETPLQKMKKAVVFMISMGTIGLSYAKPFNPIIGETFQAFIDNCPVYMEQTCHHPPISTCYFKGRGYEVYGSVNPGISIRLNSVKGFSTAPWFIKFENGDLIEFYHPKMQIGGLLVGERTFDFCETSYLFDEKNKIITELTFGPKRKFGKHLKGDKTDFLWGHIYKVSDSFMTKFMKEGKNISPTTEKSNKAESQVYGCWHEKIFIDETLVYDFREQLPCQMVHENYCLRSDSRFRMDIAYLSEEKYSEAQDEKDRLQEIQRYDVRLRKSQNK